jgi:hypothetical protein
MRSPADRYVNRLLDDRRPHAFAASADDAGCIRAAIELLDCRVASPTDAFRSRLRRSLSRV